MAIKPLFRTILGWTKRNSTKLLAGGAITSQILGYWFMHREAPIVHERIKALGENATWKDKFKAAGPVYLPAAGMLLLSSGCIIGGCALGEKKAAVMASLYSASEAALRRYEKKVVETIGEDKAQELHDAVASEVVKEKPPKCREIFETGRGNVLFYDPLTDGYFRSDLGRVKSDIGDFKAHVLTKSFGSVNDLREFLGLNNAKLADFFGWSIDKNIDVWFDKGEDQSQELCWVIRYMQEPVWYNGKEPRDFNCEYERCYP